MNNKIQYLVEGISKDILHYIMDDLHIDVTEALSMFYNSDTYIALNNPESGLYIESSAYVYELFKDELKGR